MWGEWGARSVKHELLDSLSKQGLEPLFVRCPVQFDCAWGADRLDDRDSRPAWAPARDISTMPFQIRKALVRSRLLMFGFDATAKVS